MNRLFTFRGKKQKARKKRNHEVNASGFSFCSLKKETSRGAGLDLSNRLACNAMASSVWACDGLRWGWIRPAAAGLQRKESESEVNRWIKHCGFVQSWPQLTPRCLHTRTVWTGEGVANIHTKAQRRRAWNRYAHVLLSAHNQWTDSQSSSALTHL